MNTSPVSSIIARLVVGAVCVLASTSCGSELLRTGRAPVYLVVVNTSASSSNGGAATAFLQSDVQTIVDSTVNGQPTKVPTIYSDNAVVTLRVDAKNPSVDTTLINAVTLTRYHVNFRRTDGRNTPGVDVPYPIDGGLGVTINAGETQDVAFEIVRHQAKLEPPLRNLVGVGGLGFISTIAEITFFGRDQNGNEVTATALMDVQFGDFADAK